MDAVRQSLASAIDSLFLLSAAVGVVGLVVVVFLREDRLRQTHFTAEQQEMLLAEAGSAAAGGFSPEGSAAEGGSEPAVSGRPADEPQPGAAS